ncbi:MAG: hypothetical protein ABI333_24725 [bacterium]
MTAEPQPSYFSLSFFCEIEILGVFVKLGQRLAKKEYVRRAISDGADLRIFKERPSARAVVGLIVMALSYLIGWPAVAFLGFLAVHYGEPLLVVIGGPLIYGISHVVFLIGAYLAGREYSRALMRWATRVGVERLLRAGRRERER